jgi:hypothetical protein
MSVATLFQGFQDNLKVKNADDISTKYRNITSRLNRDFWELESDREHNLQIGSYGRYTAIDGVSDLDMVFELPPEDWERYKTLKGNGPSTMLQEVRTSLLTRYPGSDIAADGQIVAVNFTGYRVEVLPAFLDDNDDYTYGDANDGGQWKTTKPRPEIKAVNDMNAQTNGAMKEACRMLRAWKNRAGVGIGGLLIDTLTYNFFSQESKYNDCTYADYPALVFDLFTYLGALPEQDYWAALGSGQRVRCKTNFQAKAKKAAKKCADAIEAASEGAKARQWRSVFGSTFPKSTEVAKRALDERIGADASGSAANEQFIEDQHPVDVRYNIDLDCEVKEENVIRITLRRLINNRLRLPIGRNLRFFVSGSDIPGDYHVKWKVRNRGPAAVGKERGEILQDANNRRERIESTSFPGNHYVEVYAIKNNVCVARERIAVPIDPAATSIAR